MKFKHIYLIALLLIVSCCKPGNYYCEIEQKVSIDSYLDCTRYVKTYLWIYNWIGTSVTIEKSFWEYDIHKTKVDSVKQAQYDKIYPFYLKLKACLDSGIDPCEEVEPFDASKLEVQGLTSVWAEGSDSIGIVFDYDYEYVTRAVFTDSSRILTIYDPAIKVVWDTLTWRTK